MQTEGLLGPLKNIEMPLVRVLANMEASGLAIDVAALRSVRVRHHTLSTGKLVWLASNFASTVC